eukprot:CAMPEP_0196750810 /NCGR_PEP_ID=MMETSP1091-20130531/81778_1 /TAXON_ID=302021 /ORGANISM="Rhodomonas sp., Strain CCMP768" /LENGTH=266 /DNA_ID=CAMNT_0042098489 /DNA_START=76 /DNA_END=876 /DNA_ORIENTATION=+
MEHSECSKCRREAIPAAPRAVTPTSIAFGMLVAAFVVACINVAVFRQPQIVELEAIPQSRDRRTGEADISPEPEFEASPGRMQQEFADAFRRGELSSSSLIHIDVPIRKWRFGFEHGQHIIPPDTPKLTHLEQETKEEMENDFGGLQRLKASGKHMANRINGIISSLQNKLDAAAKARAVAQSKFVAAGSADPEHPLGSAVVAPAKDIEWDRVIRKLNKVIRDHGGVPKPHRMHHWTSLSRDEQEAYEGALRNAFGKKPPAGMGLF